MSRYIDAIVAQREIDIVGHDRLLSSAAVNEVKLFLAEQPTADVEPVRHSYWRQTEGNWFECAGKDGCGYYTDEEHCGDYCPKCGARMDEGVKHNEQ